MLDDVIAERAEVQLHNRRIALKVQLIARLVAIPAAALMLLGLISFLLQGNARGELLAQPVIPLSMLVSRATLSPVGAMSVGLLALSLLPMVTVLYILGDSLLHRHFRDAAAAGTVAAILSIGILLGRA